MDNQNHNKEIITKELTDTDKERILIWKKKQSQNKSILQFKETDGNISAGLPSNLEEQEARNASLHAATGSTDMHFASSILALALNAAPLSPGNSNADEANAILAVLLSLKPQDELEGMLLTRMLILHKQYMNFMHKTWKTDRLDFETSYINKATKLMRLYNETLETLNRYRRKGEQKVTVQHINVSNGGQAMVSGNTSMRGGGHKKSEGEAHES